MRYNIAMIKVYENLMAKYGNPKWWPAKTPYEVIVGAVLTQNTNWSNVEKAMANFGENLSPQFVLQAAEAELAQIIRPAGFFNQKTVYLKEVTAWFSNYNFDVATVQKYPLNKLRAELLATKGIGPETADCILLYAFGFPTFVIDAYTMRFCSRYPIRAGNTYNQAKSYFEANLPKSTEIYNNFHAFIVLNGKDHCKKKAACSGCPLENTCQKIGI